MTKPKTRLSYLALVPSAVTALFSLIMILIVARFIPGLPASVKITVIITYLLTGVSNGFFVFFALNNYNIEWTGREECK